MKCPLYLTCLASALLLLAMPAAHADDAATVRSRITSAVSGTTVTLPAGTFQLSDVKVPDGVSIRGAGYNKTIIDASGGDNGLIVSGNTPAVVGGKLLSDRALARLFGSDWPKTLDALELLTNKRRWPAANTRRDYRGARQDCALTAL